MDFVASTHAARAHDAFGGIEGEVWVRIVLFGVLVILARAAVANLAQADRLSHILKFGTDGFPAVQPIQRMIGGVKFHHTAAQFGEAGRLRVNFHSRFHGSGAGRGRAFASIDFNQAEAAGTKWFQIIAGAKLWDLDACLGCGANQRSARGHGDGFAVDFQRDVCFGNALRRSVIDFSNQLHDLDS